MECEVTSELLKDLLLLIAGGGLGLIVCVLIMIFANRFRRIKSG